MKAFLGLAILFQLPIAMAAVDDLVPSGKGDLDWLFLDIYEATLYTTDGKFEPQRYPLALAINYQRSIDAADLIKTTADEWRRLQVTYSKNWLSQLTELWPDVKKGDNLTMRAESPHKAKFYFNGSPIGTIDEKGFAEAFLAIWLSPDTRDQKLRAQLIGKKNA